MYYQRAEHLKFLIEPQTPLLSLQDYVISTKNLTSDEL